MTDAPNGIVTLVPTLESTPPRMSNTIVRVITALATAVAKIEPPKKMKTAKVKTKTGDDYTYSYASLADVIAAVRGPLADEGLCFVQDATTTVDRVSVTTIVLHSSGEWIRFGPFELPAGGTPQAFGSALSYARRYALTAALGIATEDDDDGALAGTTKDRTRKASEPQMKRLHALAKQKGKTHDQLRDWAGANLGIESLVELTSSGAKAMMDSLEILPDAVVESGVAEKSVESDKPEHAATVRDEQVSEEDDDAPATKSLWHEAREVFGSLPKVIAAYRDAVGVTGTIKQKDVTNGVLRELIENARADAAS